MARGYDGKPVTEQQDAETEASRLEPREAPADPARAQRRHTLELARVDVSRRLETATAKPHREMLERALVDIDRELAQLR